MKYRKGLVFFIDVLGTKNSHFDELYKIANIFHNELENTQKRHNPDSVGDRHVIGFSDCAYIIYSLKDDNLGDEEIRLKYIYTSMYNTATMLNIFTNNGFLCRGGACYNDLYYEKDRNVIFGPAVNQAYLLESKHAVVPRILLSDELARDILEFDNKLKNENPLSVQNGNILMQDPTDNKYFINYLNMFYQHEEFGAGSCHLVLQDIVDLSYSISQKTINDLTCKIAACEEDKRSSLENILEKHKWQLWYLKSAKTVLNSAPPPFTEQELMELFMKQNC